MTRALITGVAGQDGSYLSEQLLAAGWTVHGSFREADDVSAVTPEVALHPLDLTDVPGIDRLIAEVEPTHIFNLAGISSVAYSWEHPVETAAVSGTAAVALMAAAWHLQERTGIPVRFVQAASAEIFGEPATAPQTEATPIAPVNPYGAAKALAHLSAGVFRHRGLAVSSLVLYNHESPRRPPHFVTRKITGAAAAYARGSRDIVPVGNLDARRDWGWAPDYTRAMILAAEAPTADNYVIATGVSHSVRDLADIAFGYVDCPNWDRYLVVDDTLKRPVDPAEHVGDAGHARSGLGWRPTKSFEEIVIAMVEADLR